MDRILPSHQQRLRQHGDTRGLRLTANQVERLLQYVEFLVQWRTHINLTGLRDAERMIDVLVAESLDFLQGGLLPSAARVLDLGTGAGVPGIPLAICAPELRLTLLDRSEKKVTFVRRVVARLQLAHCRPQCGTAESLARHLEPAQRFDAVVTRGVGRIALLLVLAAPLLRPGGILVVRKPDGSPELQEAAALWRAGGWQGVTTVPVGPAGAAPWVLHAFTRAT